MSARSRPEHFEWWEQDIMFVEALAFATAAGFEHPPMLGIDTRPCTAKPVFVRARHDDGGRTSSALGEVMISGKP